jgi:hypothetical protein
MTFIQVQKETTVVLINPAHISSVEAFRINEEDAALHIYTVDSNVIKLSKANATQAFQLLQGIRPG